MTSDQTQGRGNAPALVSRRRFLWLSALAAASAMLPGAAMAGFRLLPEERRSLSFYNLHTGESLTTTYFERGEYIAGALSQINYILRDFRQNEVKPIDPGLLDVLVAVRRRLGTTEPFYVISGYRSPRTNAMLRARTEGVAAHSLHLEGRAIDVRVPGRDLSALRRVAVSLGGGGVGYYPRSGFVHLDTGRVRYW